MPTAFFPNLIFAWVFLGCLAIIMATASYTDLKLTVIPKSVSVTGLILGIVFNLARGAWLGYQGNQVWNFRQPAPALGALDGALFALAGFALAFSVYFLLWILGICGGGDVKLFAALGAWVGPTWIIYVLAVTVVVDAIWLFMVAIGAVLTGNLQPRNLTRNSRVKKRLITFALPMTIAAGLVLAWKLKDETHLIPPKTVTASWQGDRHVFA